MGVDPGDVIRERAALHAGGETVLVQQVAAGHLAPASRDHRRRLVRTRESHHLVTALEQPGGQRAADEAARAGDEDPRQTIFPGFMFAPGSTPLNSACSIATPGAEMSSSSQRACSVPTAW